MPNHSSHWWHSVHPAKQSNKALNKISGSSHPEDTLDRLGFGSDLLKAKIIVS